MYSLVSCTVSCCTYFLLICEHAIWQFDGLITLLSVCGSITRRWAQSGKLAERRVGPISGDVGEGTGTMVQSREVLSVLAALFVVVRLSALPELFLQSIRLYSWNQTLIMARAQSGSWVLGIGD